MVMKGWPTMLVAVATVVGAVTLFAMDAPIWQPLVVAFVGLIGSSQTAEAEKDGTP